MKEQSIRIQVLFCALLMLGACTKTGIPGDITTTGPMRPQSQTAPQTYVYECNGGYGFTARIDREKAWLFLPNQTVSLPLVPSGSGAKYSDGLIMFWSKGDDAVLEIGDERHSTCNNNRAKAIWEDAKLRGVDFRAIGNEPGWHLELTASEKVVFVGDYGQTRYEFAAPEPFVDQHARTAFYKVRDGKHDLTIVIEGRPCHDSMSGERFETTAIVLLDGKKYRGCGKALH